MPTTFDTTKLVKIWFSKPGQPSLGRLNELRLKIHRSKFPADEITLISNLEDLTEIDRKQLLEFCQKQKIELIGLKEIEKQIRKDKSLEDQKEQLELLNMARLEITSDEGNLAAASDIVRTLSPVIKGKIYTDFDIIKHKDLPQPVISSPFPILTSNLFFHIIQENEAGEPEYVLGKSPINNHLFACNESAINLLEVYRKTILERYHGTPIPAQFNELACKNASTLQKLCDKNPEMPPLLMLRRMMKTLLNPKQYDEFLVESVKFTSGPSIMHEVSTAFVSGHVLGVCREACAKQGILNLATPAASQICNSILSQLSLKIDKEHFANDDDTSWIPSMDSRQDKLNRLEETAAITIQSFCRMYLAKRYIEGSSAAMSKQDPSLSSSSSPNSLLFMAPKAGSEKNPPQENKKDTKQQAKGSASSQTTMTPPSVKTEQPHVESASHLSENPAATQVATVIPTAMPSSNSKKHRAKKKNKGIHF